MNKRVDGVNEKAFQSKQLNTSVKGSESISVPFSDFLQEAIGGINKQKVNGLEHNFNQTPRKVFDVTDQDELIAQGVNPDEIEGLFRDVQQQREQRTVGYEEGDDDLSFLNANRVEVTPFQLVIDKAIEVLESISVMDYRVNDLTEQYIQGKVSIDEVSFETMKLNLAVSFATTILSSSTQAFKEITQLAI